VKKITLYQFLTSSLWNKTLFYIGNIIIGTFLLIVGIFIWSFRDVSYHKLDLSDSLKTELLEYKIIKTFACIQKQKVYKIVYKYNVPGFHHKKFFCGTDLILSKPTSKEKLYVIFDKTMPSKSQVVPVRHIKIDIWFKITLFTYVCYGIGMLCIFFKNYRKVNVILQKGERTVGRIKGITYESEGYKKEIVVLKIEFEDNDGQKHIINRSMYPRRKLFFELGQKLKVVYLKKEPEECLLFLLDKV